MSDPTVFTIVRKRTSTSPGVGALSIGRTILLLLAVLAGLTTASPSYAQSPSFKDHLSRGINLAHWFAQTFSEFSYEEAEKYITPEQVDALALAGFTHVRLPVVMGRAFAESEDGTRFRSTLIEKINLLNDRRLAVVLDIHPTDQEKGEIDRDPSSGALAKGWALLARDLSVVKPDRLAFEVMNEPFPMKGPKWAALQEEAARAIRAAAPEHMIVLNPGSWSSMDDYKGFKGIDLPNVIYTVHVYDPNLFTHQGAAWGWSAFAQVQALDWPIAPGAAQRATDAAAQGEARDILADQIRRGAFAEISLRERMAQLKAWQNANAGAPIWVGEFGVYRKYAPREARLRWHRFMREEFEKNGWGWAIWDYLGDFGILKAGAPNRQHDDAMIESLGLRTAAK